MEVYLGSDKIIPSADVKRSLEFSGKTGRAQRAIVVENTKDHGRGGMLPGSKYTRTF